MRDLDLGTAVGMSLLVAAVAEVARADEPRCDLVVVETAPDLAPPWVRAAGDLRATLARDLSGPDCVPVRLRLEPALEGVLLRAASRDGRETARGVSEPSTLVPIALGLLAAAPPSGAPPNGVRQGPSPPPSASAGAPIVPDPHEVPEFPAAKRAGPAAPSAVGLTLALSTGVRVGLATSVAMFDTELRADVVLRDWVVSAAMRYAPLAAVSAIAPDTDAYEEIGVGFGVGRALVWGKSALDLTLAPSVVFVTMETDDPHEKSGDLTQFRVGLAARYGYAVGAGWRLTATVDSEAAPSSLIKPRYPDSSLPPVPSFTFGLRLGASSSLL